MYSLYWQYSLRFMLGSAASCLWTLVKETCISLIFRGLVDVMDLCHNSKLSRRDDAFVQHEPLDSRLLRDLHDFVVLLVFRYRGVRRSG